MRIQVVSSLGTTHVLTHDALASRGRDLIGSWLMVTKKTTNREVRIDQVPSLLHNAIET